ncbi:MAG TPA: PQQ-binding-like beta-propeller repeat protein [Gemmataceae bacterium]|nr:PQQ-binding-like beta-propeller repeat protein [Gemmataceae bacterium]
MLSVPKTMLLLAVVVAVPGAAQAQIKAAIGDWPAWMGADRTGVSHETGLLKEWPKGGPQLLWKVEDIGEGYSTPSVAAGKIFVISNRGLDNEFVIALSVKDGSKIWERRIGKVGNPDQRPPYPGSRSTPTVDGDAVYVLGSDGDLACFDAAKGEVRWTKNLRTEFDGKPGIWAYAESPLIDGDVLVCTPGGSKATLAAFNKKTGEVIWKCPVTLGGGGRMPGNTAAYASAIVAPVGGVKQYIQFLTGGLVGVAAKDGKVLWKYEGVKGITNCTTPLFHDNSVFVSATGRGRSPTSGSALLKLSAESGGVTAKEVYHNQDLANHHGGVVRVGGSVYGTNNNALLCLDFKSGETKWQDRSVGKGSVAAADGRLYVRSENGEVALVEATPAAYKETGRFTQPDRSDKKAWPHPVIAGGRLYLRDQGVLLCYDVKQK